MRRWAATLSDSSPWSSSSCGVLRTWSIGILPEEGEAERDSIADLVTFTLGALIPDFPGSDAIVSALGDIIRNGEIDGAEAAEQFAEELSNSFELTLEELEGQLHTGVLTSAFVSAFNDAVLALERERD